MEKEGRPSRTTSERSGNGGTVPYLMLSHPSEVDRLDVQHYALRDALGGNRLAPIGSPRAILDVGCGTGRWAHELAAEFPDALVVGLDMDRSRSGHPGGYRFVCGNVLQGLPVADGAFDFVHQRLLFGAVPLKHWPGLVGDLVRVTRPGGWVELLEGSQEMNRMGPATTRLTDLMLRLCRSRGLDSTGILFRSVDSYLSRAGCTAVQRRTFEVPVGDWGDRLGSLLGSDVRAMFTRLGTHFEAHYGVSGAECQDLVRQMHAELDEHRTTWSFALAFGRRPG